MSADPPPHRQLDAIANDLNAALVALRAYVELLETLTELARTLEGERQLK